MAFTALCERQRAVKDEYSPKQKVGDKVKGKSIVFQGTEVYTKKGINSAFSTQSKFCCQPGKSSVDSPGYSQFPVQGNADLTWNLS